MKRLIPICAAMLSPLVAEWVMLGNALPQAVTPAQLNDRNITYQALWLYREGVWYLDAPGATETLYPSVEAIESGEGFWLDVSDGGDTLLRWQSWMGEEGAEPFPRSLARGWGLVAADGVRTLMAEKVMGDRVETVWSYRDGGWVHYPEAVGSYPAMASITPGIGFWTLSMVGGRTLDPLHLFLDGDGDGRDDQLNSDGDLLADGAERLIGSDPLKAEADLFDRDTYVQNMTLLYSSEINLSLPQAWGYLGGRDIAIAVVDSGILSSHPDLAPNLDVAESIRYPSDVGVADPDGNEADLTHGTICAGIIAARGFNETGVRGVTPMGRLVALDVFHEPTDATFIAALGNTVADVSSNSWGYGADYFVEDPVLEGIVTGIREGRNGLGTVYVFAAGNESGDANTVSDVHNARYVMAVAAVDRNGRLTAYSNYGASIFLAAPGGTPHDGMVSTDFDTGSGWTPIYDLPEDSMQGTSFATPVVSGIAALVLDANPLLTWRDVQWILATTANRNDPEGGRWRQNGAGLWISDLYGFGTPNAYRAVRKAMAFEGLGLERLTTQYTRRVDTVIPDGTLYVENSIEVEENLTVEHVDVWVTTRDPETGEGDPTLSHPWTCFDDLRITLISPEGTEVVLDHDQVTGWCGNLENWHYGSHHFMGERSVGEWKLRVEDELEDYQGVWVDWSLQLSGH